MDSSKRYRVLVVDDSMINRQILKDILTDSAEVIEVDNGQKACDYIMEHFYDIHIVLLDLIMPGMNGFDVLEFMRKKHMTDYLPVIMISSDNDERNIEHAFDLGAIDFISRPFMDRIVLRRVLTTIALFEKQKELVHLVDRQFVADDRKVDELTGLDFKETFFNNVFTLLRSHRSERLWMVALDIDHFKLYNHFYGWDRGDSYLRTLGNYLKEFTHRHGGIAGYLGGDDFAVLCPNKKAAVDEFEKILSRAMENNEISAGFGVKVGLYEVEDPTEEVSEIYNKAVIALSSVHDDYARHIAEYQPIMSAEVKNEYEFLSDVKRGLDAGEFIYYLQPKVDLASGEVAGAEVLIRWNHYKDGIISPGRFMPELERTGFASVVDRQIWEDVIRFLADTKETGKELLPLSINLSRADIYTMDVTGFLVSALDEYELDHDLLEVEITESDFASDDDRVASEIDRLRASGLTVIIDDFGSGYASLGALDDVPADLLKIDMKYLDEKSGEVEAKRSILESVLNVAKLMDISTIVESIETQEQVDFLISQGCTYGQGYFFYKPMDAAAYQELL